MAWRGGGGGVKETKKERVRETGRDYTTDLCKMPRETYVPVSLMFCSSCYPSYCSSSQRSHDTYFLHPNKTRVCEMVVMVVGEGGGRKRPKCRQQQQQRRRYFRRRNAAIKLAKDAAQQRWNNHGSLHAKYSSNTANSRRAANDLKNYNFKTGGGGGAIMK